MSSAGVTPGGRRGRLLHVAANLNPPGGGQCVGAWTLQALQRDWDVTLLCARTPDFAALNRHFGTQLDPRDFDVVRAPLPIRHIHRFDPDPYSFQPAAWLMRMCRRLGRDFDVVVSTDNEFDFGRPGIQYIHYPYLAQHRETVETLGRLAGWERARAALQGRLRPWMMISGIDFDRVRRNLTLVNSGWTSGVVEACYGVRPVVLYPPVRWAAPEVPWQQRDLAFAMIGRVSHEKRQVESIDLLQHVRDRGHDLTLEIVGDIWEADYAARLEGRARAAGSWVRLHHGISREALEAVVGRCRFGLHPMVDEHFGIAAAEMVRAGCVVFVHASGGPAEIVGAQPALMFASAEEAVERICAVLESDAEQVRLRDYLAACGDAFDEERFMDGIRAIVANFAAGRPA